jgi:D-serine deaminase-like pyridoxal phosphate-dependent protein
VQIDDLDTPSLLVDLDRLEKNINRMAKFAKDCGVELRPHVKTHKVPDLAKMQLRAGSKGVCLQKVSEAEIFAAHGIKDIFITNEIVGAQKHQRLAQLAGKIHLGVAADDVGIVKAMGNAVREAGSELDVYVDVDSGMGRCGVQPDDAAEIADAVERENGLVFKGIMGYEGHVGGGKTKAERLKLSNDAMTAVTRAKKGIEKKGIDVEVVSVGSSVSTWTVAKDPVVTEVQPGMYVFNDVMLLDREVATIDDCALTVLVTLMSKPAAEKGVVDAGSKAFQWDQGQFPRAFDREGVKMVKFSEEHGWLTLEGKAKELKLGDRLRFIPVHCCTCVNQHDEMIGIRGSKVEKVWPILARGKMK